MLALLTKGHAQSLGGRESFAFLRIPTNAQVAGLGSVNVSAAGRNVNMFVSNPALLHKDMSKHFSFTYAPYYAGIKNTTLAYGHQFEKAGRWGVALQYMNYGTFEETDATGAIIGSFIARDYAFTVGHARTINNFTLGANLKFAASTIAFYQAKALLLDLGAQFKHPENDLSIGLTINNAGIALQRYNPDKRLSLPLNAQLGVSFKPKFMPVRFSFTAHRLHQPDIAYADPALNTMIDQNGNEVVKKPGLADKIARHFVLGTELLLSKNFQLQAGYNHLVRQELKLESGMMGAGLSFGALIRIKVFELSYARSYHHAAGGVSYLTLVSNLGSVLKKKEN